MSSLDSDGVSDRSTAASPVPEEAPAPPTDLGIAGRQVKVAAGAGGAGAGAAGSKDDEYFEERCVPVWCGLTLVMLPRCLINSCWSVERRRRRCGDALRCQTLAVVLTW